MSETVINIQSLPEVLTKIIKTEMVRIREENGVVTVSPVKRGSDSPLFGMFKGDGHIVDDFIARKREEKDIEL